MNIVLVHDTPLSSKLKYGGTERVVYALGYELIKLGHTVRFLVPEPSNIPFGKTIALNMNKRLAAQIPPSADIVHFNFDVDELIEQPYIVTIQGNRNDAKEFNINAVFVSKNHAQRYGSEAYVHNGLCWELYPEPKLNGFRNCYHFLGKAAWKVKNLKGAIKIVKSLNAYELHVLGGYRFNFKMGMRFTLNPRVKFYGMVDDEKKAEVMNRSKGLIFPVLWHEPFGLAVIESMYYGCPVFGTPLGSLPELVSRETGFLSASYQELIEIISTQAFHTEACYMHAKENFNARKMALAYLDKYQLAIQGINMNKRKPKLLREAKTLHIS